MFPVIGNHDGVHYDAAMTEEWTTPRPPLAWMWWLPAILWAAGIFYLSARTGDELPRFDFPMLDKIVHFGLFGVLALLAFAGLRFGSGLRFGAAVLLAFALASLYGGTDELHQLFTPARSSDLRDWIADTLGAGIVFAAHLLRPRETPPHD